MVETRPELVVETGTYRGGSAFFLASICDLLGAGEVVSIDVEPVRDDYPAHPRITYLGGRSSTDPDVVAEVRARAEGKRTLVILDSDHSQAHVEAELAEYASLVPVGGYVIVEDSNIGQIRKDLLPGPLEAIETFLAGRTRSRSTASARSSSSRSTRAATCAACDNRLGAERSVRSSAFDVAPTTRTGPPTSQSTRPAAVPVGDASPSSSMPGLRVDVVRDERLARALEQRPTRSDVDALDGKPVGNASRRCIAARSTVELKNSVR